MKSTISLSHTLPVLVDFSFVVSESKLSNNLNEFFSSSSSLIYPPTPANMIERGIVDAVTILSTVSS